MHSRLYRRIQPAYYLVGSWRSQQQLNPDVTPGYFLDAICSVGGVPRILRADNGAENIHVTAFQRLFRREAIDAFAGEKSFMYGRSVGSTAQRWHGLADNIF